MLKVVWKYEIANMEAHPADVYDINGDIHSVMMPLGAEILYAREQHDTTICVWALVNPAEQQKERKSFAVIGTGQMPSLGAAKQLGKYYGSGHYESVNLVLHVFEVVNAPMPF